MARAVSPRYSQQLLFAAIFLLCVTCSAQSTNSQDNLVANSTHPAAADADAAAARGDLTAAAPGRQYRIGVDDILTVSVWRQPDLSRSIPVRPDGRISLPLVGEVQAAGKTTPELESELRASLGHYIKDPELTVMVAQIRSQRVNIIGQVTHPGTFSMTQSMGVLDALALSGGLREFAKKKQIYVLRETSDGHRTRLHYDYEAVLRGKPGAQDILLQPNDTVVVP